VRTSRVSDIEELKGRSASLWRRVEDSSAQVKWPIRFAMGSSTVLVSSGAGFACVRIRAILHAFAPKSNTLGKCRLISYAYISAIAIPVVTFKSTHQQSLRESRRHFIPEVIHPPARLHIRRSPFLLHPFRATVEDLDCWCSRSLNGVEPALASTPSAEDRRRYQRANGECFHLWTARGQMGRSARLDILRSRKFNGWWAVVLL
jgi:hypothetical protein